MPEKFIIFAALGFFTIVFAAAAIEAYWFTHWSVFWSKFRSKSWPKLDTASTNASQRGGLFLCIAQCAAVMFFLHFAHPVIFALPEPRPLGAWLTADYRSWLLLGFFMMIVIMVWLGLLFRHPRWWSVVPPLLALAVLIWFALGIQQHNKSLLLIPHWPFPGVALTLYLTVLILGDLLIFLTANRHDSAWSQTVSETTRMCAVLPAILVYLLGLHYG